MADGPRGPGVRGVVLTLDVARFDLDRLQDGQQHGELWIVGAARVCGDLVARIRAARPDDPARAAALAAALHAWPVAPHEELLRVHRELEALARQRHQAAWDPRVDEALALAVAVRDAYGEVRENEPQPPVDDEDRLAAARVRVLEVAAILVIGERLQQAADLARERIGSTSDPVVDARYRRLLQACERAGERAAAALAGR